MAINGKLSGRPCHQWQPAAKHCPNEDVKKYAVGGVGVLKIGITINITYTRRLYQTEHQ